YEFVRPEALDDAQPDRRWIANAETGVEYALVVTSNAGLWSYVVGDTVTLVDRNPPRLLVTGRTSYYLSPFGEHLTGDEIEDAVSTAAKTIGATIADFSVGAVFPDGEHSRGGHLYIVEFNAAPNTEASAHFLDTIDTILCRRNDDYRAHRSGGFGLDPPRLLSVKRGTFGGWMKSRGQLGGQHKVPRVIANAELFQSLRDFAEKNI
ncbi:MAG TPA: GH3 auxin-responsive promoter family protein, partial [Micropepsaceae bacterium]|nr:GH3 auxin-responsive promoter family protein [Micropepsaceae bacterium]